MGMHHGILVAAAGLEAMIVALEQRMPGVALGEGRGSLDTLDLDPDDTGWRLAAGELDGQAYLLDTTMLLSTEGDAIVGLSADLGCLVVGCGGETVSGTQWFYAADRGRLLRGYWSSATDMSAPWSKGEPLATEAATPLEDLDGEGLVAALASLGFDYERWSSGTDLREARYDFTDDAPAQRGPLEVELEAFRQTHAIPESEQPTPTVVRRDGGFDIVPRAPAERKGGLTAFLRRLLGGGNASIAESFPVSGSPQRAGSSEPAIPPGVIQFPAMPPAAPPRSKPRTPAMADLPPSPKHFYMEYVGGASSKFYAVSLEEEDGGTWRVRFNYGRIGFPRAWDARVEDATWAKASATYLGLVDEKLGKGYEPRPWPANLQLPDGSTLETEGGSAADTELDRTLFRAAQRGILPPATGGTMAGFQLPNGGLWSPEPSGGSRGDGPVIWASESPVADVGQLWARLAAAFPETGVWPVVIDAAYGFRGFDDYLMDMPRPRHTEAVSILRRNWANGVEIDDDEAPENLAPFGRAFPGLADRTPGDRPTSIDAIVAGLGGHLGLVAVNRPADVLDAVGWMGATNHDFDPLHMSTVLRSWEVRFDAYLVGLGTDTITLAVGRPPRDLDAALTIAAEHYAFCSDNIDQGAGSIADYAPMLVNEPTWPFWWD